MANKVLSCFQQPQAINRKEGQVKKNIRTGDHPCHLCMLARKELFDEIKKLTRNPPYSSFNCGRVADSNKNLSNPMPLD